MFGLEAGKSTIVEYNDSRSETPSFASDSGYGDYDVETIP